MLISVKYLLKLKNTETTRRALQNPAGHVLSALKDCAGIYKRTMLKRFDKFSKGGGDWPDIKKETKLRKKSTRILVDTRVMRLGLGADIAMTSQSGMRTTIGIRQRTKHTRAKMTVADLASIHHFGLGRVPRRKILVRPDPITSRLMSDRVMRGISRQMKGK